MELWKRGTASDYGFCICCKEEITVEEETYLSVKPNPRVMKTDPITRNVLCILCVNEWKLHPGQLYKIPRFKLI